MKRLAAILACLVLSASAMPPLPPAITNTPLVNSLIGIIHTPPKPARTNAIMSWAYGAGWSDYTDQYVWHSTGNWPLRPKVYAIVHDNKVRLDFTNGTPEFYWLGVVTNHAAGFKGITSL